MFRKKPLIAYLLLLYMQASCAIDNNWGSPVFKQYTVADGLPNSSVNVITQDKNGIMWIGVPNGLVRFDGYKFKLYPSTSVLGIFEDKRGFIWSATRKGLIRLDPRTDAYQHFLSDKEDIHSISDNYPYSFLEDDQGELWIGTGKGINLYKADTQSFEHPSVFSDKWLSARSFIQYGKGRFLLGTDGSGLVQFDHASNTIEYMELEVYKSNPDTKRIFSLVYDQSKNQIWMATKGGLVEYQIDSKQSKLHLLNNMGEPAYTLYADHAGRLWVGHIGTGACQFDTEHKKWLCLTQKTLPVSANSSTAIYQSRDGIFWIGLLGEGLLTFDLQHPFRLIRFEKPHNRVNALNIDKQEQLWVGTYSGVIKTSKQNQNKRYKISREKNGGISAGAVYDIYIDQEQQIWAGTDYVLGQYDPTKDDFLPINVLNKRDSPSALEVTDITQIEPSILLLSTLNQGFLHWSQKERVSKEIKFDSSKPKNTIKHIYGSFLDSKNRLWVYGFSYLAYLNKATNHLTLSEFVKGESVFFAEMIEDKNGQLWLLSESGLYKVSEEGKISVQYDSSDFDNASLSSLVNVDEYLWVGTSNGLWRLNTETQSMVHYTEEDGLQSNIFSTATDIDADGNIFMGGDNGITVFHPDNIKNTPKTPPEIILTDLLINNQYVEVSSADRPTPLPERLSYLNHLQLTHKQSQLFSIEFNALNFLSPNGSQYAYKLDGLNDDWIYTDASNQRAVFTSLAPGSYTFRVKAANSFDVWNETERTLTINILPPWWRSFWAYLIYGGLFITALFWFIHYRTTQSRLRATQLEHEVKLRTQEIQQQKKTIETLLDKKNTLFANVSHEFRTPLTLILGPAEKMLHELNDTKYKDGLSIIKRNGKRLLNLVEQLLTFSKLSHEESLTPKKSSLKDAVKIITSSMQSRLDELELTLSLNSIPDVWVELTPENALQTILINLLDNAVKYTPVGGDIELAVILKENSRVCISITDTGPGIPEQWLDNIFERFTRLPEHIKSNIPGTGLGLALVKDLVDLNHGHITAANHTNGGAIFTVELPGCEAGHQEATNIEAIKPDYFEYDETQPTTKTVAAISHDPDVQHASVLIIDDNADMRHYITGELNQCFNTLTAEDGESGLLQIKSHMPDIIICDIMMPGIDGLEVLRRLRNDIEISHIPLILLTAKGGKENRIKGYQDRADDYVVKPFEMDELKARIQNIIDLQTIRQEQTQKALLSTKAENHEFVQNYRANEKQYLEKFRNLLEAHYMDSDFNVETMAKTMNTSQSTFNRKIRALVGHSPYHYLRIYRLQKAAQILKAGYDGNMAQLADAMGFSTQQHFSSSFKEYFGVSPKEYQ